ncbi:alpha/beta fold hydrolase, partial [Candidatus Bipolaricaulota bacterium]|nr:alpha/beta fold hydrolase [Candidatus Bipolaricaulota bacterium]
KYRKISFTSDKDIEIRGWYLPSEKSTDHCIILAPGKGENRWDMLEYAPFLVNGGFSVLLFDPRSTGLSDGDRYGFGYFESRDLLNAVDFLIEQEGISKIGLLGRSAGATASLLAAEDDSRVGAVVADSPYANLKLASKDFGNYSKDWFFQAFFPVYMFSAKLALGVDIYRETDVLSKMSGVETPTFFIHGLKDDAVGYQNSEKLFEKKPQPKRMWLVPETTHVAAFENVSEEYKLRVLDFFRAYL